MPEYQPDLLITIAVTATSALSALSCGAVLLSYARFPSLRRHPASLILARCVADLLFCLGTFVSHLTPYSACEAWSFMSQFFAVAAELYSAWFRVALQPPPRVLPPPRLRDIFP
jgi:hypothetical protein